MVVLVVVMMVARGMASDGVKGCGEGGGKGNCKGGGGGIGCGADGGKGGGECQSPHVPESLTTR
jgi:hypothetical protein